MTRSVLIVEQMRTDYSPSINPTGPDYVRLDSSSGNRYESVDKSTNVSCALSNQQANNCGVTHFVRTPQTIISHDVVVF